MELVDKGALAWFRMLGYKSFLGFGTSSSGMVELAEKYGFVTGMVDLDTTVNEEYTIGWCCNEPVKEFIQQLHHCKYLVVTYNETSTKEDTVNLLAQYDFHINEEQTKQLKSCTTMNVTANPAQAFVKKTGLFFEKQ